jgi:A/G-specific adenine glycosylase
MSTDRDRRIAARVEHWFALSARDLPWRGPPPGRRDPYHALVCETMAQQTQIARVAERFVRFIDRFPTVADLAAADGDDVRALWSGLGYYRRAANLHAAAKMVVERFGARVPRSVAELRTLPGVGAYTAGAIASVAAGQRAAAVDGNVARVLLRVEARPGTTNDPADRGEGGWAWRRAEALVHAADSPGAFNEGLMELGATICTPAAPKCDACPLSRLCRAKREAIVAEIPAPAKAKPRADLFCDAVILEDARGRLLIERRPERGMWAGLWQAPTLEGERRPPRRQMAALAGVPAAQLEHVETFIHMTTHRAVHFRVWRSRRPAAATIEDQSGARLWRTREQIAALALSRPQRRILLQTEAPVARASRL